MNTSTSVIRQVDAEAEVKLRFDHQGRPHFDVHHKGDVPVQIGSKLPKNSNSFIVAPHGQWWKGKTA